MQCAMIPMIQMIHIHGMLLKSERAEFTLLVTMMMKSGRFPGEKLIPMAMYRSMSQNGQVKVINLMLEIILEPGSAIKTMARAVRL